MSAGLRPHETTAPFSAMEATMKSEAGEMMHALHSGSNRRIGPLCKRWDVSREWSNGRKSGGAPNSFSENVSADREEGNLETTGNGFGGWEMESTVFWKKRTTGFLS